MNDAKEMKKFLTKSLALVLVLIMSVSVLATAPVKADEEDAVLISAKNDYSPYSWHPVVKDKVKTFANDNGGVIANCYYERIVLVGFKKGTKKINKALKKLSSAYSCDDLYDYAREAAEHGGVNDVYSDFTRSDVSYADQKYFSVVTTREWYAGGVGNYFTNGYVFNLDTGKRVSITTATGSTLKQVKNAIISAVKNDSEFGDYLTEYEPQIKEFVNGLKASDINYYINGYGKVVVLVAPYTEPFYGGWTREYVLEDLPCVYDVIG